MSLNGASASVKTDCPKIENYRLSFPPHIGLTAVVPSSPVHTGTAGTGNPEQLCLLPW